MSQLPNPPKGSVNKCKVCGESITKTGDSRIDWLSTDLLGQPGSSFCRGPADGGTDWHQPEDGPLYVPEMHHTVACEIEYRNERVVMAANELHAVRSWWCWTHGQWTYNFGKVSEVTWPDGSVSRLP